MYAMPNLYPVISIGQLDLALHVFFQSNFRKCLHLLIMEEETYHFWYRLCRVGVGIYVGVESCLHFPDFDFTYTSFYGILMTLAHV